MKKEDIKKKIVKALRKIKKIFIKLGNAIKNLALNIWKKFLDLPKKVRYVLIVWAGVLVVLLLFIAIANSSNKFFDKYKELEQEVNDAALKYVNKNEIYVSKENKLILDIEILQKDKYLTNNDFKDKSCDGFSVIYYDDLQEEYKIDSYLNCKDYTTENYWDYK